MSNIGKDPNDRGIGEYWEDVFCGMAKLFGWEAWPFQRMRGPTFEFNDKMYICPDVWILRRGDRQFACEIKHKTVATNGCYGFEEYRAISLLSLQNDYSNQFGSVVSLYVVHNWYLAGGKYVTENYIEHWHAQRLDKLEAECVLGQEYTLYKGVTTSNRVPIHYYPHKLFIDVREFLS